MELPKQRLDGDDIDDDGRPRRTGTAWTASAHIITTVLGSGVLSLAWGVAQLGWIGGPAVMTLFAAVIYYTSTLLADCYRSGDPVSGPRNRTYMAAVRATLGGSKVKLCGAIQFANLFGIGIGITIAAAASMRYVLTLHLLRPKSHSTATSYLLDISANKSLPFLHRSVLLARSRGQAASTRKGTRASAAAPSPRTLPSTASWRSPSRRSPAWTACPGSPHSPPSCPSPTPPSESASASRRL
jgi:hypothetical protein